MKVVIQPSTAQDFEVYAWRVTTSGNVLSQLRAQLKAAAVLWPDLKQYEIEHK